MSESPSLDLHRQLKGKLRIQAARPLKNLEDLALLYTPGVADACSAIVRDPAEVWELTGRGNLVAIVSDGSAVLGLGNIGPLAGLPVMEGKALLFREFAQIDAVPLVLNTQDVEEICRVVECLAPSFGGINLEDIAAPRCFEIEEKLQSKIDIPVFHDDQHGTAVVVLAALLNVTRCFQRSEKELRIVVNGAGAAGSAITRLLLASGFTNITVCDRQGILGTDYIHRGDHFGELARLTRPQPERGNLAQALEGANVFIGVSAPGVLNSEMVRTMHRESAVFALANPIPEISPEELLSTEVRLSAFGKSGSKNQINNVLAFPGIFRGVLDVRASKITQEMKIDAARALSQLVSDRQIEDNIIIPSPFDPRVVPAVAFAVAAAAEKQNPTHGSRNLQKYHRELCSKFAPFEIL